MIEDRWGLAREKLEAEQEESQVEISRLKESLKYELEYDLEEGDPDLYEREKSLALLRNLEQKLDSITYALGLIQEGTYGVCEQCGREISAERLEALPHTTFCIECKALLEKGLRSKPLGQLAC